MKVHKIQWKRGTEKIQCQQKTHLGMNMNKDCLSPARYKVGDVYMCPPHAAYTVLQDSVKGTEVLFI